MTNKDSFFSLSLIFQVTLLGPMFSLFGNFTMNLQGKNPLKIGG